MEKETKEKFWFHDTIISWACIIWAVASIALMIYFTGLNQVTFTIMTFGQLFLVMGIIFICRKQITGSVFTVTGLACIIIPAINEWGPLFNSNITTNPILPIFIVVGITLIGLCMLVVPSILENIAERKCKKSVNAECFDFKTIVLKNGNTVYAPTYKYNYNDKEYIKVREKYSKNQEPAIGSIVEIKINEEKPEEVYFKASKASMMLIYIFGISFLLAGIGMLITLLAEL